MSRARNAAGKAVRYGPHVLAAAKLVRGPAEKAAREALDRRKARRDALAHAEAITDGTVLQVSWQGDRVWVVWSGQVPVAAYPRRAGDPPAPVPLEAAVEHVDPAKRRTPDEMREQTAMARARRAARARIRRRRPRELTR